MLESMSKMQLASAAKVLNLKKVLITTNALNFKMIKMAKVNDSFWPHAKTPRVFLFKSKFFAS
jgi:hypothetical protein